MDKITEKVGNIKMLMDRNDIMRSFSQFIKDGDPFGINFINLPSQFSIVILLQESTNRLVFVMLKRSFACGVVYVSTFGN